MKITGADIDKISNLANLELTSEEKDQLVVQLSRVLDYVEQLNKLDTSGVDPTSQVVTGSAFSTRDDRAVARTGSGDAGKTTKLFKVPKVITER